MTLPLHEYILTLAQVAALAILVGDLVVTRLARAYPFFFCYLCVELLETLLPFTVSYRSVAYGWIYFGFECAKLCLYVVIVFELYAVLLRDLKGIARLARRYSIVALGIGVLLSLLVVTSLSLPRNPLRKLFYLEIPILSSLVLFILLIAAFLAYYPVPLHRNALVYAAGYVVYFISKTTLLFLSLRLQQASLRIFSPILLGVGVCCVIFWTIFLRRAGERRTVAVGSPWSPPDKQQQVLLRLRQLNDSLLRARPK